MQHFSVLYLLEYILFRLALMPAPPEKFIYSVVYDYIPQHEQFNELGVTQGETVQTFEESPSGWAAAVKLHPDGSPKGDLGWLPLSFLKPATFLKPCNRNTQAASTAAVDDNVAIPPPRRPLGHRDRFEYRPLCWHWNSRHGCQFGSECHFRHDEADWTERAPPRLHRSRPR